MKSTSVLFFCLLGLGLCGSVFAHDCKFGAPTCTFEIHLPACPPAGLYRNKQMIGPWQFFSDPKVHPIVKTDGTWDSFSVEMKNGKLRAECTKVIPPINYSFSVYYKRHITVAPEIMKYLRALRPYELISCKFRIYYKSATCTVNKVD